MWKYIKKTLGDFVYHIKHSVVKYLMITYLLVLLIPIICNSMIYVKSVRLTRQQIDNVIKQINKETASSIDALQVECYNVYYTLFNNPTVQKIASSVRSDEELPYLVRELKGDIASVVQQKRVNGIMFEDIQLYFSNGFCVGADRGEELGSFFAADGKKYFTDMDQMLSLINEKYKGTFLKNNSGFSYVNTIRFLGFDEAVTLLIHISEREVFSHYDYMDTDGIAMFMLNRDGELIFTNSELPQNATQQSLNGSDVVKIDGEKYLRYEKNMNAVKFVCLLPQKNIEKDVVKLKIMIVIQILLAVIFGGLTIRYIMRKNIKSINEILLLIKNDDSTDNEIELIKNSILSSKENINRLNSRIDFLEFLAVNDVIMNLVYGLNVNESFMKKVNIEFPYDYFYVSVMDIADRGDFEHDGVFPNGKDPLFVAISNVINEMMAPLGKIYIGIVLNEIIIIINSTHEKNEILLSKLKDVHFLIAQHLNVKSRIVLSEKTNEQNEISAMYYEAINCMEHLRMSDETEVILSTKRNGAGDLKYDKQKTAFVNCVMAGDKFEAVKIVEDIALNGVNNNSNISVIKYVLVDIMMTAVTGMSKKNASAVGKMMENNREIFEKILSSQKFSSVKSQIYEFVKILCETAQSLADSTNGMEEKVRFYIDENYTDASLSVKTIASKFSITYAYLSNRFKTKFGMSMTDYIEELRITKAKQLMIECPNKSVDEISAECGYVSKLTFSRQFKKLTDITPGKYRELHMR